MAIEQYWDQVKEIKRYQELRRTATGFEVWQSDTINYIASSGIPSTQNRRIWYIEPNGFDAERKILQKVRIESYSRYERVQLNSVPLLGNIREMADDDLKKILEERLG